MWWNRPKLTNATWGCTKMPIIFFECFWCPNMYIFSESWDLALLENLARFCIFCEQVRILTKMRPGSVLGKSDFLKNRSKYFFWDPIKDRTKRFQEAQTYQNPVVNWENRFTSCFFGFLRKKCAIPTNQDGQKMQKMDFPKIDPKWLQISNIDAKWV